MFFIGANAHFKFLKPPYRGDDDLNIAPCGGSDMVNTSFITNVTMQYEVSMRSGHGNGTFSFYFALVSGNGSFTSKIATDALDNVTKVFNTTVDFSRANVKTGTQGVIQAIYVSTSEENVTCRGTDEYNITSPPCGDYNEVNNSLITTFPLKTDVSVRSEDGYLIAAPIIVNATVDLSKAKATNGTRGVIQVIYKSEDGNETWYQCAEVLIKTSSAVNSIPHSTCGGYKQVNTSLITTVPLSK
ncbi:7106_t:CDS:10 [Diversispora eburnea]|uniref:7106_t:CDS:1 n=1 Tax=Diversispora eburnea TaxID=1213867 RepID=A0A9N9BTM2_9GLOM|nr:7106_t:CDS:10 [Diversispora eburnea]